MAKKTLTLIFSFCLSIFLFLALVSICLAGPMDFLDIQVPFGELPAKLKMSGSMFAEYIKALFVFSSAAISVFAIIMMMSGGVQWVLSEGTPDKIGKAKDTIFKAFIGLFIALFSVFILQIVNPGAVTFQPLSPSYVEPIGCCSVNNDLKALSEKDCLAQQGTVLPPQNCVGELITIGINTPTTEAACTLHTNEEECKKDTANKCVWKNNACFADVGENVPTVCQEVNTEEPPAGSTKKKVCEALQGCVWMAGKVCTAKPGENITNTPEVCVNATNINDEATCKANPKCEFFPDGACIKHLDTANLECDKFTTKETCPTTSCVWDGTTCKKTSQFGQGCNDHGTCGDLGFCCKNGCSYKDGTKVINATPTPPYSGVCVPRINHGLNCYNKSATGDKNENRVCAQGEVCAFRTINVDVMAFSVVPVYECWGSSIGVEGCKSSLAAAFWLNEEEKIQQCESWLD